MTSPQERLYTVPITFSASGDNTVIGLSKGDLPAAWDNGATYIAIDHINLIPNNAVTLTLYNGTTVEGQSAISGAYSLTANQGFVLENAIRNEHGIITLGPNKSLVINLNSNVQVSGFARVRLLASN